MLLIYTSLKKSLQNIKTVTGQQNKSHAKVASLEKELEQYRKPPKDSNNSSIPSSQNRWDKKYPKRPKSTKKVGGQFGHIGCNKPYLEPTEIINLNDNICPYCGGMHFEEKISKLKRKHFLLAVRQEVMK